MVPHLVRAGMEVDVAHFDRSEGLRAEFEDAGASVFARPADSRPKRIAAARSLILRRRPDVVHTTLFEADIAGRVAAWRTGTPVTSSLVTLAFGPTQRRASGNSRWKTLSAQAADATTIRLCHRLHAITETVADTMAKRLFVDRQRITVIPRGRDAARLGARSLARRRDARSSLGIGDDQPLLLAIGRHAPAKGLDVAIRAMREVLVGQPRATLVIAGREGASTSRLRAEMTGLGVADRIRLLGPRTDVPDLLVAADLLVFPSRWEGFGGALIEALALETPIVASDLPELREVLGAPGPLCGTLVEVGDATALAHAILAALDRPDELRAQAARGLRLFQERYEIHRVAEAMRAFHETSAR